MGRNGEIRERGECREEERRRGGKMIKMYIVTLHSYILYLLLEIM